MAKKRRQKSEKKEDYDFKFPVFDEHEYIALELRKIKLAIISFIYAILMVIVTYALYTVTYPDWRGPIVLGLLAIAGIPFIINIVKIDTTDFDWKNWFGAGGIYFFSWLAFFILVCNPPFSDFAEPEIEKDIFYLDANDDPNNWTKLDFKEDQSPTLFYPIKIKVRAKITDNSEVDKESVKITIEPSIFNNASKTTIQMKHVSGNIYEITMVPEGSAQKFQPGDFSFTIEAKDINGHKKEIEGEFNIESEEL